MAFGFQINDALGNKVLDDSMLVMHMLKIINVTSANGSLYLPETIGIANVNLFILNDDVGAYAIMSVFGVTYNNVSLSYNASTHTAAWTHAFNPAKILVMGSGDTNKSYGVSVSTAGSINSISQDRKTMVFVGKASYVGTVTRSGATTAGTTVTMNNIKKYVITTEATVTAIMPMFYSTTGFSIIDITKVGNTFEILCTPASNASATLYCFADSAQVTAPAKTNGMAVYDASGGLVFTSDFGRTILRSIDVVNVTHSVAFSSASITFTHKPMVKPIYGVHALGSSTYIDWWDTVNNTQSEYLIKRISTTQGQGFVTVGALASNMIPATSQVIIADGADYD